MRRRFAPCSPVLVFALLAAAPAAAQEAAEPPPPAQEEPGAAPPADEKPEWKPQRAEKLGLEWLLPEGVTATEEAAPDGWTTLTAKHGEALLRAFVRPGALEAPTRMEMIALGSTQIPLGAWKLAGQGKDLSGWKWYRSYQARNGDVFVIAILGHGDKGSYLIYLQTTPKDFGEHAAAYKTWFSHLKLF